MHHRSHSPFIISFSLLVIDKFKPWPDLDYFDMREYYRRGQSRDVTCACNNYQNKATTRIHRVNMGYWCCDSTIHKSTTTPMCRTVAISVNSNMVMSLSSFKNRMVICSPGSISCGRYYFPVVPKAQRYHLVNGNQQSNTLDGWVEGTFYRLT